MSNRSSQDGLPTRSTTNTPTFLESCALDADHKVLEEHLLNNPEQQSDLDSCLLRGLQIVQRKERELSHVAQALTTLLQSGAKWNSDTLLDEQKTPYHLICESPGDHHELLDLMIKSCQQNIIDARDIDESTALIYAVRNANVNCVKCMIDNSADVDIGYDTCTDMNNFSPERKSLNPIIEAIRIMRFQSRHSFPVIMTNIFDLLFDAAVEKNNDHFSRCTAYILWAVAFRDVHSVKKLIKMGAPLDIIGSGNLYGWESVAIIGNIELLKCMFNSGIDKDSTNDDNCSILWWVVMSGNIKAVRYLLDIGVAIPTYTPKVRKKQCKQCKKDKLIMKDCSKRNYCDPCLLAIDHKQFEIVKLLDEYGCPSCKTFMALRRAVKQGSVNVTSYLLKKYTYTLNLEYFLTKDSKYVCTLLTDSFTSFTAQTTKLLLDHGADPAKPGCLETNVNGLMYATIHHAPLEVIAQYIRSGIDVNFRSCGYRYGIVSPFEASVLYHRPEVSELLHVSGCSLGVYSTHKVKADPEPRLEELLKECSLYDNSVTPLKQLCQSVILNHLSPQADLKIEKLPLPGCLIKFLGFPELDNIVSKYSEA